MKNKVLIRLYVPELDKDFELFIPINEYVWKLKKLILKSISDLSEGQFPINSDIILMNKQSGFMYNDNQIIVNTDIRNSTEIVLILKN